MNKDNGYLQMRVLDVGHTLYNAMQAPFLTCTPTEVGGTRINRYHNDGEFASNLNHKAIIWHRAEINKIK